MMKDNIELTLYLTGETPEDAATGFIWDDIQAADLYASENAHKVYAAPAWIDLNQIKEVGSDDE